MNVNPNKETLIHPSSWKGLYDYCNFEIILKTKIHFLYQDIYITSEFKLTYILTAAMIC